MSSPTLQSSSICSSLHTLATSSTNHDSTRFPATSSICTTTSSNPDEFSLFMFRIGTQHFLFRCFRFVFLIYSPRDASLRISWGGWPILTCWKCSFHLFFTCSLLTNTSPSLSLIMLNRDWLVGNHSLFLFGVFHHIPPSSFCIYTVFLPSL